MTALTAIAGGCREGGGGLGPEAQGLASEVAVAAADGRIAFVSNRDGNFEVYSMNPDGTDLRNLTQHPADDFQPDWSPDGTRIAFSRVGPTSQDLWVMSADGSGQTVLTSNGADPAWSPDGARVAFDAFSNGNFDVHVVNVDGSGRTNLTNHPADDYAPDWSPDGTRISFTSSRDHPSTAPQAQRFGDLYVMEADGSDPTRLTHLPGAWVFGGIWSPDGELIAFSVFSGERMGIYLVEPDGSGLRRIKGPDGEDGQVVWSPAWSPDATRIAYTSVHNKSYWNPDVFIMNADGTGARRITDSPAWDGNPRWHD